VEEIDDIERKSLWKIKNWIGEGFFSHSTKSPSFGGIQKLDWRRISRGLHELIIYIVIIFLKLKYMNHNY